MIYLLFSIYYVSLCDWWSWTLIFLLYLYLSHSSSSILLFTSVSYSLKIAVWVTPSFLTENDASNQTFPKIGDLYNFLRRHSWNLWSLSLSFYLPSLCQHLSDAAIKAKPFTAARLLPFNDFPKKKRGKSNRMKQSEDILLTMFLVTDRNLSSRGLFRCRRCWCFTQRGWNNEEGQLASHFYVPLKSTDGWNFHTVGQSNEILTSAF